MSENNEPNKQIEMSDKLYVSLCTMLTAIVKRGYLPSNAQEVSEQTMRAFHGEKTDLSQLEKSNSDMKEDIPHIIGLKVKTLGALNVLCKCLKSWKLYTYSHKSLSFKNNDLLFMVGAEKSENAEDYASEIVDSTTVRILDKGIESSYNFFSGYQVFEPKEPDTERIIVFDMNVDVEQAVLNQPDQFVEFQKWIARHPMGEMTD